MPLEGKQIGRYHILHILGSGGMGEVYLAEDARIGQQVAIKMVRTEVSPYDDRTRDDARLFLREAKTIATLDHPRILPLFDYGDANIDHMIFAYLVMPYRQEGSLTDWLRQRGDARLSSQEAAHILEQAADALQHAHDHSIIHQDVKPSNFLVRSKKESFPDIFLTDFGIAHLASATSNASQAVRGTPTYMAPEQWEGEPVAATDQYALAVMSYELLTGRTPFQGNPGRMMYQHINTPPQPASTLNLRIPAAVDAVLLRALSKRPEERFDSIATFSNAFQQAVADESFTFVHPDATPDETKRETFINTATATSEDNLATYRKPISSLGGSSTAPFQQTPVTTGNPGSSTRPTSDANDIHATLAISREEARIGTSRVITLPAGHQAVVSIPANTPDGHVIRIENTAGGTSRAIFLTMSIRDATPPSILSRQATQATQKTVAARDVTLSQPARVTPVTPIASPFLSPAGSRSVANNQPASTGYIRGGMLPPASSRRSSSGRIRLLSIAIILFVLVLSSSIVVYAVPGVAHALFGGTNTNNNTSSSSPSVVTPASAATITIRPTKKDLKNTFNLTAVPKTLDANQQQIAARYTNGIRTDHKTVTTTGSKTTQATTGQGSLTFYNGNSANELAVPAGVSWTGSDGVVVVNDQAVHLAPATGGAVVSITVNAHAATTGANTNIAYHDVSNDATSYLVPIVTPTPTTGATTNQSRQLSYTMPTSGGGASVSNEAAFTGGQDAKTVTTVSQNDITDAGHQLVTALQPVSAQGAKEDIHANERDAGRGVFCKTQTTSDPLIDTVASNVTVTTKETCSYEVYNQDDATALAQKLLQDQAGKDPGQNYTLTGNITAKVSQDKYNNDETIAVSADASGTWVFQFSDAQKQQLAQSVAGKHLNIAESSLSGQTGVGQVKIDLGDPNAQLLPGDASKINIVIQP